MIIEGIRNLLQIESMDIKVMEQKLYDACLEGDVEMLKELMREDGLTLAQLSISSCYNQTPLHLASMLGHFEFAKSLLSYKPDFASRLDSQDRSPLHVASANGYATIVKLLLEYDQEMCRVHDEDGRTPLHLAVMNGQLESVIELMKLNSFDDEETVFHLCVTYNRLNLLIRLLELNFQDLSNIKDGNGNTVLHTAAALKRMQMIKYLVKSRNKVDVNAVNKNGLTALDIVEQMPKDLKTMEIKELLISANHSRVNEVVAPTKISTVADDNIEEGGGAANDEKFHDSIINLVKMWWNKMKNFTILQEKSATRDEYVLMAATVIAAMAYQAATSPPGGIAGVDATEASAPDPYGQGFHLQPADSLLAYFYSSLSNVFWISNTISFMAALSVIFLYVTGATLKQKLFIWLIRGAMWITLTAMIVAYACAVRATTPSLDFTTKTLRALVYAMCVWMGLILLSISAVTYRAIRYVVRRIRTKRDMRKKINTSNSFTPIASQNAHIVSFNSQT
ncbi:ankyrin repeat-containing protein At2g01680-like [Daucus carota subsp. sativus]